MASQISNFANALRDNFLAPRVQQHRTDLKQVFQIASLAAVVIGVVSLFFAALLPKTFILILAGVVCFAAREVYVFSQNYLEMLKNAQIEIAALLSDQAFTRQLTKKTFVAEMVFDSTITFHRARQKHLRDYGLS